MKKQYLTDEKANNFYKPIKQKKSNRVSTDLIFYYSENTVESLLFAVVNQAIRDLKSKDKKIKNSAWLFFYQNNFHLSNELIEKIFTYSNLIEEWNNYKLKGGKYIE